MQTSSREQNDYHHGPNKDDKETRVICLSDTASTTSSSILGRFANSGIKTFERLSCQSTFRRGCKRRTFLVDREFKALQWKVPIFSFNRLVHIVGCINEGVGRHMPGDINRQNLVTGGTEGSHQHTRTEGSAFSSSEHVYPQSTFIATSERPTSGHIRKNSSFGSKRNSKTGGLVGFCKSLASKGISGKAAKLISDSRRENPISSYESAWCQWAGWCGKQKNDPFRCPLKFVLDYLSDIFEKGQAYRTINVHKSAISAYHEPLHGFPIVQSPLVCSLLGGVFNHRPPQLLKKLFVI